MGSKISTRLRVQNDTDWDITTTAAYGLDNFDWWSDSRPDRNFVGVQIKAKSEQTRWGDLNPNASNCPFTMKLTFSDCSVDEFRVHQRHAIGCCIGFNHMVKAHDITCQRKEHGLLVVTVKNTKEQVQNQLAEKKNKEGEMKMEEKKYEEAIKLFDEALKEANQSLTIDKITTNNSEACLQQGLINLEKAFEFENEEKDDKSEEAQVQFDQAKTLFEKSRDMKVSPENDKNLNFVNLKIDGNRIFNEANELEKQAFSMFQAAQISNLADDYDKAQNKYSEAKVKYEEAMKKFEEGATIDSTLSSSVNIVKECAQGVNNTIEEIEKFELGAKIGKVELEEEKEEEERQEEVHENVQEQIEIVAK